MFCIIILSLVLWLILDYRKDKRIEKRLNYEKYKIYNDNAKICSDRSD